MIPFYFIHTILLNKLLQADYERAHKYPVAPHMDRTKTTRPRIAADFMDFVATPMFRVLAEFLPPANVLMDYISVNRQAWQKGLDELTKAKDEADKAEKEKAEKSDNNNNDNNNNNNNSSNDNNKNTNKDKNNDNPRNTSNTNTKNTKGNEEDTTTNEEKPKKAGTEHKQQT